MQRPNQTGGAKITDALGRVWTRAPGGSGDLYRHDDMAWPQTMVERLDVSWPGAAAFDNPNYTWCGTCLAHREETADGE